MTQTVHQSTALAGWQEFETELRAREDDFANLLPPNVDKNRFLASAIAAVKKTPNILNATKRSIFSALTQSAQDGLIPDGREGVITVYNTKQPEGGHALEAKWNPMVGGLRKRARELDEIIIDAQPVYMNDKFIWHQGDDARIEHTPAPLNTDRGDMIGAYAIFRKGDGILHREVMAEVDIEKVRKQSQAPDSLMWTTFKSEGYKKTVVRRGIKSVPVSAEFAAILKRDDEAHFDFSEPLNDDAKPFIVPKTQANPFNRDTRQLQQGEGVTLDAKVTSQGEFVVQNSGQADSIVERGEPRYTSSDRKAAARAFAEKYFEEKKAKLLTIENVRAVSTFADEVENSGELFPDQLAEWQKLCDDYQRALIDKLAHK